MRNDSINQEALRAYLVNNDIDFHESNISYILKCPKCCKADKLYIRKEDGRFICWVCAGTDNFRGKPEYALKELTDDSLSFVRKILYGEEIPTATLHLEVNINDFWSEGEEEISQAVELKPVQWPLNYYPIDHKWSIRGAEYLWTRGINLDIALKYGVRYWPEHRRIAFPVSKNGILYGWQNRLIVPHEFVNPDTLQKIKQPKAVTSEGLKKEQIVMFGDNLDGYEHCILTEGPISAIKADLCGGNVATMGKAVSSAQIQLIRNAGIKKLYLALDPDAAKETALLVQSLASEMEVYSMIPKKGDLGDLTFQEVYDLFLNATRVSNAHVFFFLK